MALRSRVRIGVLLLVFAMAFPVGGLVFIYSGLYDVAATRQHTAPVYWALITTLRRSIHAHAAREVGEAPDLFDPVLVDAGLPLYDVHCAVCHGAPGVPPGPLGLGLTPPPSNLMQAARDWSGQEIFWTIKHGLKMTGMPAWEFRLTEQEMWEITAFVRAMSLMTPADYREMRERPAAGGAAPGARP